VCRCRINDCHSAGAHGLFDCDEERKLAGSNGDWIQAAPSNTKLNVIYLPLEGSESTRRKLQKKVPKALKRLDAVIKAPLAFRHGGHS
jgi:hypothetical protein